MELNKPCVLVVDMLNEFVFGGISTEKAPEAIPPAAKLIEAARKAGVPVVYTNDAHIADVDHELAIWGNHAIAGTEGAQVVPQLAPAEGDYVIPKRTYSGFHQTSLEMLLRDLGVETCVVCGLYLDICVRCTCMDAFLNGFKVVIADEATDDFTPEGRIATLDFLKRACAAPAVPVEEIIAAL